MKNKEKTLIGVKFSDSDDVFDIEIVQTPDEIKAESEKLKESLSNLDNKLERYVSHADALDIGVSAGIGALSSALDIIFVDHVFKGKITNIGDKAVDGIVKKLAKLLDPKGDYSDVKHAISFFEKIAKVNYDQASNELGGGYLHHLRDLAHHPSILGLVVSIISQFKGTTYGIGDDGLIKPVEVGFKGKHISKENNIFHAVSKWACHLISDMAGSSGAKGRGMGIPGPIMSFLTETSSFLKMNDLTSEFEQIYENGFDFRQELAMKVSKSFIVGLTDGLVRAFYFIRRLVIELKNRKETGQMNWKATIPFGNRTITRMMSVSMSTMMGINLVEKACESAVKSGGNPYAFGAHFLVSINYPGLSRCSLALGTDVIMGFKESKLRKERMLIIEEYLSKQCVLIEYKQGENWKKLDSIAKTVEEIEQILTRLSIDMTELFGSVGKIDATGIDEKNKGLSDDVLDELKWG